MTQIQVYMISCFLLFTLRGASLQTVNSDGKESTQDKKLVTDFLNGRKLRITTVLQEPYFLSLSNRTSGSTEQNYIGVIPDILDKLSERLGFQYQITPSPDGKQGNYDISTDSWDGTVGELKQFQASAGSTGADLAATPMTVTRLRNAHVTFLVPVMEGGFVMSIRRPQSYTTSELYNFSLFTAGTDAVWFLSCGAPVSVALTLWLIYRMASRAVPVEDKHDYGIGGALWFVLASVEWQGYMKAPSLFGAKVLMIAFFAFVTGLLAAYMGALTNYFNAATQLKFSNIEIENIQGLDDITFDTSRHWKFSAVAGSDAESYIRFCQTAACASIRESWDTSLTNQLVENNDEGFNKLSDSDDPVVFITEQDIAEYEGSKLPCDVLSVGRAFGVRSYSFAMPKDHPLEEVINRALSGIKEEGGILEIKEQWLGSNANCSRNIQPTQLEKFSSKRANLGTILPGLFFIGFGFVLCFIITILDLILLKSRGKGLSSNERKQPPTMEGD